MEHNKSMGSDGFPAEFYQQFGKPSKLTLWHI
jgi:hypothetical protein